MQQTKCMALSLGSVIVLVACVCQCASFSLGSVIVLVACIDHSGNDSAWLHASGSTLATFVGLECRFWVASMS